MVAAFTPVPDAFSDELPPQSIESEEAVLACLLMDGSLVAPVSALLGSADFFRPWHRTVYAAMLTVSGRGEPVDFVTVMEELDRNRSGLSTYQVSGLMTTVPMVRHVEHYAAIVRRAAFSRALIAAAGRIAAFGYANPTDVEGATTYAEAQLAEVRGMFCPEARPGPARRLPPIYEVYVD